MDVLVVTATGRLGRPLAAELLARGHRVRALTRTPESAAAVALAERGAEVVRADMDDPVTLGPAVRGADAVFLATTPHHGIGPGREVQQAVAVADAAADAGVGYLVYSSAAGADRPGDVPILHSKRRVEDHLQTLALPHAVLAPVIFMENLHYPWNAAVLRSGRWPIPLPPARPVQLVSVRDVAAVAARVVERPAEFAGERFDLAGDELTGREASQVMAAALDHPVTSVETVPELAGMALLFQWIAEVGFHADIPMLRRRFADVPWSTLAEWVSGEDCARRAQTTTAPGI